MGYTLFGVTASDAHVNHAGAANAQLITVRELSAIASESNARATEPDEAAALHHNDVVTSFSARGTVLPAPVGVVFKGRDAVERWLELHYVALTDALSFVENRMACRVNVYRSVLGEERETNADLVAIATESLRTLRQLAVATVALRPEQKPGAVMCAAYLVEADQWQDFQVQVDERGRQSSSVRFEMTGPWPPYDFVQMQLGA
ncbi:MAG: GvpL/GvpF family gas vesicle protein [bacterium]